MVAWPARCAPVVLAAADSVTVPDAAPAAPPVTTIQATPLAAVHAQPSSVVTSTDRTPPAAVTVSPVRLSWNRHGAAACVICRRCPFTRMLDDRGDAAGFDATEYGTSAEPWPLRFESAI